MAQKQTNGNGKPGKREDSVPLAEQKGFFKIPARFGHVPVAEEPLGYNKEKRFEHHYPRIELPFQIVDVVETGAKKRYPEDDLFEIGLNRLFFGDCLHVMRSLPSETIDLIYIDPPFFSGRNYNIIFGDQNEVRSFSDIWEGGMPGYLIWLNTRLYEIKRVLKKTGSIYVHLDWHASHYVKVEMDKIFGYDNFINEVVWAYRTQGATKRRWSRKHDVLLLYGKSDIWEFNYQTERSYMQHTYGFKKDFKIDEDGKQYRDALIRDIWEISALQSATYEAIGYPTQKPEALLERIIQASSNKGDVVADFFCGGGTTLAVAQKLGRRWIGCDISRVAVALTADRIARILAPNLQEIKKAAKRKKGEPQNLLDLVVENPGQTSVEEAKKRAVEASPMPLVGYSVEHWGIYEINRLSRMSLEAFRGFVLECYGAGKWTGSDPHLHGVKGNELLWIAGPKETDVITAKDVKDFAQAVMKSRKPEDRQAVMIGWGVDPKARAYAEQVMALGQQKPIQFIKLRLWPLAGEEFKAYVTRRHDKYKDFFAFILPPDIPRIGVTRLGPKHYRFDVSEARSMNTGGRIVNVQWDFDFRDGIFSASQGYQLCRKEKKGKGESGFEGETAVEYTFEEVEPGTEVTIACRVQDDLGGEGMKAIKLKLE